jgi:hypothetical protein
MPRRGCVRKEDAPMTARQWKKILPVVHSAYKHQFGKTSHGAVARVMLFSLLALPVAPLGYVLLLGLAVPLVWEMGSLILHAARSTCGALVLLVVAAVVVVGGGVVVVFGPLLVISFAAGRVARAGKNRSIAIPLALAAVGCLLGGVLIATVLPLLGPLSPAVGSTPVTTRESLLVSLPICALALTFVAAGIVDTLRQKYCPACQRYLDKSSYLMRLSPELPEAVRSLDLAKIVNSPRYVYTDVRDQEGKCRLELSICPGCHSGYVEAFGVAAATVSASPKTWLFVSQGCTESAVGMAALPAQDMIAGTSVSREGLRLISGDSSVREEAESRLSDALHDAATTIRQAAGDALAELRANAPAAAAQLAPTATSPVFPRSAVEAYQAYVDERTDEAKAQFITTCRRLGGQLAAGVGPEDARVKVLARFPLMASDPDFLDVLDGLERDRSAT